MTTLEQRAREQHEREIRTRVRRLEMAWMPGQPLDAAKIMAALWPHGWPEQVGKGDWWRTPLGVLCAEQLGDETGHVTYGQAAEILGVTTDTIGVLIHRGTLARHRGGGTVRGAVLTRMARLQRRPKKAAS